MPSLTSRAVALSWLVLGSVFVTPSAEAQDAAMRIQERAQMLRDMAAMLDGDDPVLRMAAFEEAMRSDDDALQTMAMDRAFESTDVNLQTAGLRVLLDTRSELALTVLLPDRPSDVQQNTFEAWHGTVWTRIERTGNEVAYRVGNSPRTGQIVPGGITSTFTSCTARLEVAGAKLLAGTLECTYTSGNVANRMGGTHVILPVRIDVP